MTNEEDCLFSLSVEESFGSPSICADGKNFVTGSSDNTAKLKDKKEEMVTGQPPFCNYMKSTKIFSDPVNLANLQIRPIEYATSVENFSFNDFLELILNETVPVSLSAVAVLGLPDCGKSKFIEDMFTNEINLKRSSEDCITEYMKKTKKDTGLSVYALCVLGGLPQGEFAWSLASRRLGITYSVISSIIRKLRLKRCSIKMIKFEHKTDSEDETSATNNTQLDEHLNWIYKKSEKLLMSVKDDDKMAMLLSGGFSLVNIFDAGVNKALYDLLPYIANYCDNLVRLVFFSMNRDGDCLSKPPCLNNDKYTPKRDNEFVMHWRPRMDYLIHFASLGYQPELRETQGDTVFVGTWEKGKEIKPDREFNAVKDTLLKCAKKYKLCWINEKKHWCEMHSDKCSKNTSATVEKIIAKRSEYKCCLPVKWMFLRSYLSSDKFPQIIVHKDVITSYASNLNMNSDEVCEFLKMFVKYGSMLQFEDFHNLKKYIIINIYMFSQKLNKLYYPDPTSDTFEQHRKFGILSRANIANLIGNSINEYAFIEIVTELGMASKIAEGSLKMHPSDSSCVTGDYVFVPTARVGSYSLLSKAEYSSAYIEIDSAQFPANIQASIASAMINMIGMTLIVHETANVSVFETKDSSLILQALYYGKMTELRVTKYTDSESVGENLQKILKACCIALTERRQQIRDLTFQVGIKCKASNTFHGLYCDSPPKPCSKAECVLNEEIQIQQPEPMQLWIKAAKACKYLPIEKAARLDKKTALTCDESYDVAKALEKETEENVRKFGTSLLEINEHELQEFTQKHHSKKLTDWRLILKLIFLWEERKYQNNQSPYKQQLAQVLYQLGKKDLACKLDVMLINPQNNID